MRFRKLDLERAYDSGSPGQDVLLDFYIPVLGASVKYDRLAGYFSSAALAVAARGIAGLIRNGGRMRVVASPYLPPADVQALEGCVDDQAWREIAEGTIDASLDLECLADEIMRDHVRAMAWMLAEGRLEIRLVVPCDAACAGEGLFHQKVGILSDGEGDAISFSGSINETAAGWTDNIEEFKVFRSWESGEEGFLGHDRDLFDRYWSCSTARAVTISLPDAARSHLLSYAPDDISDLELDALVERRLRLRNSHSSGLRDYQERAVSAWFENDCRGILEMATATGKTRTAVAALARLRKNGGRQLCVITAPYQHVAVQWARELKAQSVLCLFEKADWRKALADLRSSVKLGRSNDVYICTVQNTAANPDFLDIVAAMSQSVDRCVLTGDEVHGLGAPEMQKALAGFYTHRLGLSATPERWFDDAGNEVLRDFFGSTVFTFGIREALDWRDPVTGLSALCPYRYWPVFVNLGLEELEDYHELTERIVRLWGRQDDEDARRKLNLLLFRRAEVVKKAGQKIDALEAILDQARSITQALIYCHSTEQMEKVMGVLLARGIRYHRFTGEEDTKPSREFGGSSERERILRSLSDGDIDVLVAMKCLDEGVDVPSARIGIILASSLNPREFIQRRGRLLRRADSEGKDHAEIFDVVVAPSGKWPSDPRVREIEYSIFGKELERIDDFAETAMNGLEARTKVLELMASLA